jgi:hypothetical protein
MSSSTAPAVSLRFSLVDNPRTQIEEWYEDLMAQARRLCIQWDMGHHWRYHLGSVVVASDAVWNAVPGNIMNLAAVLAQGDAPQYRARPDFDSPVTRPGRYSCRVSQLEAGDGYAFCIYTGPKNAFVSVVDQCGACEHDHFKSRVYPYPSPLPHPPPDCRLSTAFLPSTRR